MGRKRRRRRRQQNAWRWVGDRVGAPILAVPKVLFVRMLRSVSLADELTQGIWVRWAFFLRAQSDRLPAVSRMPPEGMGEDSILKAPAFVGMWIHRVVFGLHRRRHMSGGSGMTGKRACDRCPKGSFGVHVRQMSRTVCSRWKNVRRRAQGGERLFPNSECQRFTARKQGEAGRMGYEKAEELGRTAYEEERLARSLNRGAAPRNHSRQTSRAHERIAST